MVIEEIKSGNNIENNIILISAPLFIICTSVWPVKMFLYVEKSAYQRIDCEEVMKSID